MLTNKFQEYILLLLASLFDRFKAKNPIIATIIIFVLGAINYLAVSGTDLGVFNIQPDSLVAKAIYFITLLWGLLQGSRTTTILSSLPIKVETPVEENKAVQSGNAVEVLIEEGSILDSINKQRIGVKI